MFCAIQTPSPSPLSPATPDLAPKRDSSLFGDIVGPAADSVPEPPVREFRAAKDPRSELKFDRLCRKIDWWHIYPKIAVDLRAIQCLSHSQECSVLVVRLRSQVPGQQRPAGNPYTAGVGRSERLILLGGLAYCCIWLLPLNLCEGTEAFREVTSVARQLICRTTDTLSALRWLCIVLTEQKPLPIFIELVLRELGMHEMPMTLHTFNPMSG